MTRTSVPSGTTIFRGCAGGGGGAFAGADAGALLTAAAAGGAGAAGGGVTGGGRGAGGRVRGGRSLGGCRCRGFVARGGAGWSRGCGRRGNGGTGRRGRSRARRESSRWRRNRGSGCRICRRDQLSSRRGAFGQRSNDLHCIIHLHDPWKYLGHAEDLLLHLIARNITSYCCFAIGDGNSNRLTLECRVTEKLSLKGICNCRIVRFSTAAHRAQQGAHQENRQTPPFVH